MLENRNYDAVVVDAEQFLCDKAKPRWLAEVELHSRFSSLCDQYPNAKYFVAFSDLPSHMLDAEVSWRDGLASEAKLLGWYPVRSPGYHSWDMVAWLVSETKYASGRTLVLTDDFRSFGLLTDSLDMLIRGAGGLQEWSSGGFRTRFGFAPEDYWGMLALLGGWSSRYPPLFEEKSIRRIIGKVGFPVRRLDDSSDWIRALPIDRSLGPEVEARLSMILPSPFYDESGSFSDLLFGAH